jgi:carbohydrate kinase (thermoresistant glucokinase family)
MSNSEAQVASQPPRLLQCDPSGELAVAEIEAARALRPTVLVLMGVSGSGKSTVARELQRLLGWPFQEGDDLHPPENVAKMRSGQALDDADRLPWLQTIARWIDARLAAREPGIITCSNLKRAYREITIGDRRDVTLVYLKAGERLVHQRVLRRTHRYMPPSLLRSQFDTLEEPDEDEHAIVVTVQGGIAETVLALLRKLARERR